MFARTKKPRTDNIAAFIAAIASRLMKVLTERQYRRREKILATARDLIVKDGYENVTMRNLAAKANVTPKTLYHQFGNKEKLLRTAVEERFRHTYQALDDHDIPHGIDKLFFIVDAVAESTRKNIQYALALAPIISSRMNDPFASIRLNTYRKAIQQIADEGDFVEWVDLDIITQTVYRHINPLYVNWHSNPKTVRTEDFTKFDLCLMLSSITRGYTQKIASSTANKLQKSLQANARRKK